MDKYNIEELRKKYNVQPQQTEYDINALREKYAVSVTPEEPAVEEFPELPPEKTLVQKAYAATFGDFLKSAVANPGRKFGEAVGSVGLKLADKLSGGKLNEYAKSRTGRTIDESLEKSVNEDITIPGNLIPTIKGGQANTQLGNLKNSSVDALKTASYVYGGGTGTTAVRAGLQKQIIKGSIQGAKAAGIGGLAYGAGSGLEKEDATVGSVLKESAITGLIGAVTGGIIGAGIPIAGKVANSVRQGLKPNVVMDSVARMTPTAEREFQRLSGGKTQGEYLVERGLYDEPDALVKKLYERQQQSMAAVDDQFAKIQGTYKHEPIQTALDDLVSRETRISSPGAKSRDIDRASELAEKHRTKGLTMSEVNEAKRMYERNVRLDYLKSKNTEGVERANAIDSSIREWQLKTAKDNGFMNLDKLNKETQMARHVADGVWRKNAGQVGNNQVTLTDWVLLSGDPTGASIPAFAVKKFFQNDKVRSGWAKYLGGDPTVQLPKADVKTPLQLPSPQPGASTQSNNVPINLPTRPGSNIDAGRFPAPTTGTNINPQTTNLLPPSTLPSGFSAPTPGQINLPKAPASSVDGTRFPAPTSGTNINPQSTNLLEVQNPIQLPGAKSSTPALPQSLQTEQLKAFNTLPSPTKNVNSVKVPKSTQVVMLNDSSVVIEAPTKNTTTKLGTIYHGTSAADAASIQKNGFNNKQSSKSFQENPDRIYASVTKTEIGDHSAKVYGDTMVDITPKPSAKIMSAEEWSRTVGQTSGTKESKKVYDAMRKAGYDAALDSSGEVIILNPNAFDIKKPGLPNKEGGFLTPKGAALGLAGSGALAVAKNIQDKTKMIDEDLAATRKDGPFAGMTKADASTQPSQVSQNPSSVTKPAGVASTTPDKYVPLIKEVTQEGKISAKALSALIQTENGKWDETFVNPQGSDTGLGQHNNNTYKDINKLFKAKYGRTYDRKNGEDNIKATALWMNHLVEQYDHINSIYDVVGAYRLGATGYKAYLDGKGTGKFSKAEVKAMVEDKIASFKQFYE